MMSHFFMLLTVLFLICFQATADTDINFSGTLVKDPCSIEAENEAIIVDFKAVASKTFIYSERSAPQRFELILSDCDLSVGQSVAVAFLGEEEPEHDGFFVVTGSAQGVSILIEGMQGETENGGIVPNQPSHPLNLDENKTVLKYQAYLQSFDPVNVVEGEIDTTLIFALSYE